MAPHSLTNFEIHIYHQKEPRFDGFYSRNTLPKTKDGAYIKNHDVYKSIKTHWIALYVNDDVTYFDSSEIEYIPKEITKFIGKNIATIIY